MLIPGLILIVAGIVGFKGRGFLSAERVQSRDGVLGGFGPGVAVASGIGLVMVDIILGVGFLVLGVGGDSESGSPPITSATAPSAEAQLEHTETETSPTASAQASPPTTGDAEPSPVEPRRSDAAEVRGPTVVLSTEPQPEDEFPAERRVVDGLDSPTVLRVIITDAEPGVEGAVKQCVVTGGESCANAAPFLVGGDGRAEFQYLVSDDLGVGLATEGCAATGPRCSLVVEGPDGSVEARVDTIFGEEPPRAGKVTVTPQSGIEDGDRVTVAVRGFPAGETMQVVLCSAPDVGGTARCGEPGPMAPLVVDPDGSGSAEVAVRSGPVGSELAPCDRRATCGVAVLSANSVASAPIVEISFAEPPGANYDPTRLLIGIAATILLALAAIWIFRRTDWRPPREGDGHEIDAAAYADLDAAIAALPPEDDREDIFA